MAGVVISSIRARLLVSLLATFALGALVVAAVAYRNVLHETEALFDYQLRQMALSLRDQGEINAVVPALPVEIEPGACSTGSRGRSARCASATG